MPLMHAMLLGIPGVPGIPSIGDLMSDFIEWLVAPLTESVKQSLSSLVHSPWPNLRSEGFKSRYAVMFAFAIISAILIALVGIARDLLHNRLESKGLVYYAKYLLRVVVTSYFLPALFGLGFIFVQLLSELIVHAVGESNISGIGTITTGSIKDPVTALFYAVASFMLQFEVMFIQFWALPILLIMTALIAAQELGSFGEGLYRFAWALGITAVLSKLAMISSLAVTWVAFTLNPVPQGNVLVVGSALLFTALMPIVIYRKARKSHLVAVLSGGVVMEGGSSRFHVVRDLAIAGGIAGSAVAIDRIGESRQNQPSKERGKVVQTILGSAAAKAAATGSPVTAAVATGARAVHKTVVHKSTGQDKRNPPAREWSLSVPPKPPVPPAPKPPTPPPPPRKRGDSSGTKE